MDIAEEKRIPATLVLAILVLYTALGGFLMSELEVYRFNSCCFNQYSFILAMEFLHIILLLIYYADDGKQMVLDIKIQTYCD